KIFIVMNVMKQKLLLVIVQIVLYTCVNCIVKVTGLSYYPQSLLIRKSKSTFKHDVNSLQTMKEIPKSKIIRCPLHSLVIKI
ncbi:MAG: hypothetical protein ACRDFB_02515, partial [Rhabdochlamydiaceae bacterium]